MNKEFVPYTEALALKELGIEFHAFAIYTSFYSSGTPDLKTEWLEEYENYDIVIDAPLYQQAFRWFREKYGIMHRVTSYAFGYQIHLDNTPDNSIKHLDRRYDSDIDYNTYEEAELACLRKLIEIAMKNDKPQFTLHKLPEGFIITSDEGMILKDICYQTNHEKTLHNLIPLENETQVRFANMEVGSFIKLKVIAQQDQIDFSSLSPEMQKEIGWFDWLRIAILSEDEELEKIGQEYHSRSWYKGVEFGFQKALELLSDRTFTKKDMFKLMEHLRNTESRMMFEVETRMFVSKPKSWKVELEHVCEGVKREGESCSKNNNCSYPNCGKVKIIKLI